MSGQRDDASETAATIEPDRSFLESLVQRGADVILTIDTDSTIQFTNRSVEDVFGYTPDEVLGEPLTMLMPERFEDRHLAAMERYLETGERQLDWDAIELPGVHKEGHEIDLAITFHEHERDGERLFSGIVRDITDRKTAERELRRQNEQLERFASVVSHDLRDPLNAAHAQLALARNEAGDNEYLDELEAILDRMNGIIEDVLTLTREGRQVGEPEPVRIETIAREAWRTAGQDTADLVVERDLEGRRIAADPSRLRSVLENLFGNAVRHAGPEVRVTVGWLEDGPGFYVADDGPGIPVEERDEVFAYGHTTAEEGTGLGLSIVQSIAEAHGWRIDLTESDEGGTRVEIHDVTRIEPADER